VRNFSSPLVPPFRLSFFSGPHQQCPANPLFFSEKHTPPPSLSAFFCFFLYTSEMVGNWSLSFQFPPHPEERSSLAPPLAVGLSLCFFLLCPDPPWSIPIFPFLIEGGRADGFPFPLCGVSSPTLPLNGSVFFPLEKLKGLSDNSFCRFPLSRWVCPFPPRISFFGPFHDPFRCFPSDLAPPLFRGSETFQRAPFPPYGHGRRFLFVFFPVIVSFTPSLSRQPSLSNMFFFV